MTDDLRDLIQRWQGWMTGGAGGSEAGPVADAVLRLLSDRSRWSDLRQLVEANDTIPYPEATLGWFWYDHAVHTAVRVRRLADEDTRSASLGRLLIELDEHSGEFTRRRYLACWRRSTHSSGMWETFHRDQASEAFDRFAGTGGLIVTGRIRQDRDALRDAVAPVKLFVDKRIAHHNPDHDPALSYEELSDVIDLIAGLWRKYSLLVCQVDPPLAPPADNTNWGAAFDVAWRRPVP
jgi:hypothetical protein